METSSKFKVLAVGLALVACACGSSSDTIPCPYGGTAPAISSFRATPSMLSAAGGSITLSWDITGATSIAIDPDVGDVTDIASNSKTIAVASTTSFQLTATNPVDSAIDQVVVTVAQP
jgi:hypothetical protein